MAPTLSSPWGKPGAWALDAEEHEAELQQNQPTATNDDSVTEFPSLSAAAVKQPKKKKKQNLSLPEFATSYGGSNQSTQQPKGLTHDDLLNLPTGPRQRSAEELDRSRLGGGFRSYGLSNRNGDDSSNSRWENGRGNNSRVPNRDSSREHVPSRADEVDDWSKTKKSPVGSGFDRRERGSFFESHPKADEADSWLSKKPMEPPRRFSSSSGGFDRRGSIDSLSRDRIGGFGGADSDNWGRKKEDGNGAVTGSARPKLVLQPRTLPVSDGNGSSSKPKGANPFGDARPREEVLAEKGKDWKEIDEKLESLKINKEVEKREKGNGFGWRSSGNGRGGDRVERSWRKPDVTDSDYRPQSAGKVENVNDAEIGHSEQN